MAYEGQSLGTLLHWSAARQPTPLVSVPLDGETLVNLAAARAADIMSVTEAATHPVCRGENVGGGDLVVELSSGTNSPHVVSTQAGLQTSPASWNVKIPQATFDWFRNNIPENGSAIAVAAYYQITRKQLGGTLPITMIITGAGLSNHLGYVSADNLSSGSARPTGDPVGEPVQQLAGTAGDPAFAAYGASDESGTLSTYGNIHGRQIGFGATGAWSFSGGVGAYNRAPSGICHEVFVDDLRFAQRVGTSSTLAEEYAAFLAEHQALWTKAYGEDGWLYPDLQAGAYTDPDTLLV
ncbi:hypothetical protein MBENS4_1794 [Novosphingobium sp. MBES04]|nr:hypothetical protein MBENS4_1794 [Novosphingobium sp. MBES04]